MQLSLLLWSFANTRRRPGSSSPPPAGLRAAGPGRLLHRRRGAGASAKESSRAWGRGAAGSRAPRPLGRGRGACGRDWTEAMRRPRSQGASRNPGWVGPRSGPGAALPSSPAVEFPSFQQILCAALGARPDKHRSRAGHWEVSPRPETVTSSTGDRGPSSRSLGDDGVASPPTAAVPGHATPRHATRDWVCPRAPRGSLHPAFRSGNQAPAGRRLPAAPSPRTGQWSP